MKKLASKVLFKYLLLLLVTFFMGISLTIASHLASHYLIEKFEQSNKTLKLKLEINHTIENHLHFVHLKFLELSAATKNLEERKEVVALIKEKIALIRKNIDIINYGGFFQPPFSQTPIYYSKNDDDTKLSNKPDTSHINLSTIYSALDTITPLLEQRDIMLSPNNRVDKNIVQQIRMFNTTLSTTFTNIQKIINNTTTEDQQRLEILNKKSEHQEKVYHFIEALIIIITVFIVLFVVYTIFQNIITLYKEMENQLYIDAHTKLKNRFALLKELDEAENPSVSIIDINSFRTINELYGASVGNEVLILFANLIKQFSKNKNFRVYRISGDEFVFFNDSPTITQQDLIMLLEDFFKMMENKKIYVAEIDEFIYLDLSVGISFEKENTLGTADIALHKAKELRAQFVFYHSELDSVQEIKQGALWKKRIVHGIENDLFLPFFQPIVDKEQKIVKYEALMRLKQDKNGTISFISPYEFLDIASKTRLYDQISKMTLLKSIEKCAQTTVPISLNLSYYDILNQPLHEEIKKAILKYDIGEKLIFEILESQNIKSYDLLKKFMADFEQYGVRFAIDDFGTGFSNFSHIFELSPDFIKIDGSLIKNIHTDIKSYELVKAIVFFSEQLGIQTIAEFVHSKEVFDIVQRLGVDQFQGYYFGEPKEII